MSKHFLCEDPGLFLAGGRLAERAPTHPGSWDGHSSVTLTLVLGKSLIFPNESNELVLFTCSRKNR